MHRFYLPDLRLDDTVALPEDEARHAARVLRLSVGDVVAVFDGKGLEALARIESVAPRRVRVRVLEPRVPAREAGVSMTLAQALLKSDKMDRVIRDAVMLGVSAVQPLLTSRTDVPRSALASGARRERWDRTVVSSVKQCGRAVVPPVLDAMEFGEWLASTSGRLRLMFVEPGNTDGGSVRALTSFEGPSPLDAAILIGPEGGWDPAEVNEAAAGGVSLVTLGSRVLRADAAGAAAIAVLRYVWRDL